MKRIALALGIVALCCAGSVAAEEYLEPEPVPWYENEPEYQDNTGALGTGDNSADIVQNGEEREVTGAVEGEITLHRVTSGIEVFSSLNKVELIERNSDGWVGSIDDNGSTIVFKPAGRPELECPVGDVSNWYGPCKVPDAR